MKLLITGGAGYIGSAIATAAADRGWTPIVLDDLSRGRRELVRDHPLFVGDVADGALVDRVFAEHPEIAATIHCAARIVVPESVVDPIGYYRVNVAASTDLVAHLTRNGCRRLVFSSSASLYRGDGELSVTEGAELAPQSPYATTKLVVERLLGDVAAAGLLRAVSLRYFNPVGADPATRTGHYDPAPSNVLGRLLAAHQSGDAFTVNGTDWPTRDGTPIRDYIHVWDLARAHLEVVERFEDVCSPGSPHRVVNLGTGDGTTVRELVQAFNDAVGGGLTVRDAGRRAGDVRGAYADTALARELLGWSPRFGLVDAIRHALAWSRVRESRLGLGFDALPVTVIPAMGEAGLEPAAVAR